MSSETITNQWHQRGIEYFLKGNYSHAASLYEHAITIETEVKSHYWYLGLALLLQGQEVEAQTTWLMALMEGEAEQVNAWNAELSNILQTEAERQEELQEYSVAFKIRQNIQEISPENIHNLLHLLNLTIKLKTYRNEDLEELGIIKILQSEPRVEVNLDLLAKTLKDVLSNAPFYPSTIEFAEVSSSIFVNNHQTFINILLPAASEIGYAHRQPKIASRLTEILLDVDPNNTECLTHLSAFYQNAGEFDKGIETAKLLCSLVETLPEKISANRQLLRGLMSAGGHWEESCAVNQLQEELILALIEQNPRDLQQLNIARLFNANYFAYYIDDNAEKKRKIQNKLLQLCQENRAIYAQSQIECYAQGHINRKKQGFSDEKIKIGYISNCLRSHSVGWLARWLLQYHDRDKFEINGYFVSNSNITYDLLHKWYVNQVDKAYKSSNIWSLAEEIYKDEVNILVDLDSITLDTTCEVVGMKPAPVQVTWLGWDAAGSSSVDYFIADPYVLPETAQEYYCEKIWRLPQTYIAVDGFEVNVPKDRRDQLEIPSDAVVYFCAQRAFKRHPTITKLQLRIIKEVPNSYFLIKGMSDEKSIQNLFHQLAEEEGVDSTKLRFLPDSPSEGVHRANLGIADIVLDTYPYNGATTTLETLWMCIPMVTRVGEQFAARNSYTMMINAGIKEGIAWTDEEYLEWGVRLGKDESLRQQIAWKLKKSRDTSPLWSGQKFTLEMEKAYEQMWKNYLQKEE